jgi:hypothetical protein
MRVRLSAKGRDLARRLRAAETTLALVRAEDTATMTPDERASHADRLRAAETVLGGVMSELTAAIPNNGADRGGGSPA